MGNVRFQKVFRVKMTGGPGISRIVIRAGPSCHYLAHRPDRTVSVPGKRSRNDFGCLKIRRRLVSFCSFTAVGTRSQPP